MAEITNTNESRTYKIEVRNRLEAAFGTLARSAKYLPGVLISEAINKRPAEPKQYKAESFEKDKSAGLNVFGKPYFDQIRIVSPLEYLFPLDPLVDFRHIKKFVETEVTGGEEVVEMIATQAVGITIRGILWNNDGKYPETQLTDLLNVFKKNTALDVNSKLFNLNGIKSIYIKELDYEALEGYEDTQPFVIQARSHIPVELSILESE